VIHRFTAKQAEEPQISQIRADFLAAMPPNSFLASSQEMILDKPFSSASSAKSADRIEVR
jgi:hypothetical protein